MPIYKLNKKNKDGIYQYRVTYNYTDALGKYRQKTKLVYGAAEAKVAERYLEATINTDEAVKSLNLKELYDEYIAAKTHEVRESTLEKSKKNLKKHVLPHLEKVKLEKLNINVLQEWKNHTAALNLKIRTKQNIYKEFRALLNFGVKMGYITSNPLLKVGNFKDAYTFENDIPEEKIKYYTADEYKKFISGLDLKDIRDYSFYVFFSIAFFTGMRKGEINALRWCDLKDNTLTVRRSVTQKLKGKQAVFTPPKNKSSHRSLKIPKSLVKILKKQKTLQQKEYKNFNDELLICGGDKPLSDTGISNKNIALADKAGLHHIRIHDFRHTHATLLINEGINIQEIARRLGHSDVNITWKIYAHLYPREEERALKTLDSI